MLEDFVSLAETRSFSRSARVRGAAFTGLQLLSALGDGPARKRDIHNRLGALKTRLITLNVHDAVMQVTEGSCDLLIAYHHPSQPLQLDPDRYQMLILGHETLVPFAKGDAQGAPMFSLPAPPGERVPFLSYADGAYLGRLVEAIIKLSPTPLGLELGIEGLLAAMAASRVAFEVKAHEFRDVLKIGRTQLQDAVPMTLGQEFLARHHDQGRRTTAQRSAAADHRGQPRGHRDRHRLQCAGRLRRDGDPDTGPGQRMAKRVAESVTLVTALNPIIGYEKAALIAKTAFAAGGTIAQVAESLGIMSQADMIALLVPERLTQPVRLVV